MELIQSNDCHKIINNFPYMLIKPHYIYRSHIYIYIYFTVGDSSSDLVALSLGGCQLSDDDVKPLFSAIKYVLN